MRLYAAGILCAGKRMSERPRLLFLRTGPGAGLFFCGLGVLFDLFDREAADGRVDDDIGGIS